MTYQEFVESKERLAQLEKEYGKALIEREAAARKLRRLAVQMEELDEAIKNCKHYK